MTVDAGRRLLFLGVILWLGHQDCRALLPPTTDQHVQIGKKNFQFCHFRIANYNLIYFSAITSKRIGLQCR